MWLREPPQLRGAPLTLAVPTIVVRGTNVRQAARGAGRRRRKRRWRRARRAPHPSPNPQHRAPGLCGPVEVTLVDANHCPGAAQLLFALPGGRRYVHVGDFRFHARMLADARLAAFQRADALYLDTTYCKPAHCFPLQARGRGRPGRAARAPPPARPPPHPPARALLHVAPAPAAPTRAGAGTAAEARAEQARWWGRACVRRGHACMTPHVVLHRVRRGGLEQAAGRAGSGRGVVPALQACDAGRGGARAGGRSGVCGGHAAQANEGGRGRGHPPPLPHLGALQRPCAPPRWLAFENAQDGAAAARAGLIQRVLGGALQTYVIGKERVLVEARARACALAPRHALPYNRSQVSCWKTCPCWKPC